MTGFKDWFKERYPGCDSNVWFAYKDEMQDDALERLGDSLADYIDEQVKQMKEADTRHD